MDMQVFRYNTEVRRLFSQKLLQLIHSVIHHSTFTNTRQLPFFLIKINVKKPHPAVG